MPGAAAAKAAAALSLPLPPPASPLTPPLLPPSVSLPPPPLTPSAVAGASPPRPYFRNCPIVATSDRQQRRRHSGHPPLPPPPALERHRKVRLTKRVAVGGEDACRRFGASRHATQSWRSSSASAPARMPKSAVTSAGLIADVAAAPPPPPPDAAAAASIAWSGRSTARVRSKRPSGRSAGV